MYSTLQIGKTDTLRQRDLMMLFNRLISKKTNQNFKSQSAMEYLTTYGWAILIIAIVIAVLFELNIFNPNYWTPKIPPGSCIVSRGTYGSASLVGSCGEGIPKFVAQFNGQNGYINIPDNSTLDPTQSITITAWANIAASTSSCPGIVAKGGNAQYQLYQTSGYGVDPFVKTTGGSNWGGFGAVSQNQWNQFVFTYDVATGSMMLYLNGKSDGSASATGNLITTSNPIYIGQMQGCGYFNGDISNVQIYSTALSANNVQALYVEGIGGTPIKLKDLVGWWPLNGNANDYSGNGNSGTASSVLYSASWYNNYV